MSSLIDAALAAIKLTPRVLFAAWAFGALVLLIPDSAAGALGLREFRAEYSKWIGPATIGAFCLWLPSPAAAFWGWARRRLKSRRQRRNALASLETLSKEEYLLLGYFVHHDAPTQLLIANYPPARSLCSKGLMSAVAGTGYMFNWPYTIPSRIWEELQERRESLFPQIDSPEAAARFRRLKEEMDDRLLYGGI